MISRGIPVSLRTLALVPAGAIAVHQLRYVLAFGPNARHELTMEGHAYLHAVAPWALLLAAIALVAMLARLLRAWDGPTDADGSIPPARRWSAGFAWTALTAALIACFVAQELLEGLFETHGANGLTRVFGDGGWWALPAAATVAALLVLALRGEDALVATLTARRLTEADAPVPAPAPAPRPAEPLLFPTAPLASARAGRAPPAVATA